MLTRICLVFSMLWVATVVEEASGSIRKLRCEYNPSIHNSYMVKGGDLEQLDEIPGNAEQIIISNVNMNNFIPNDTFYNFRRHLLGLFIWDSNVVDVAPDAFRGLDKLVYLSMDRNRLTTVKDSWLQGFTGQLCYLGFGDNPIQNVELEFIDNAPQLKELSFGTSKLHDLDTITAIQRREEFLNINIWGVTELHCSPNFQSILREKNVQLSWGADYNGNPIDWFKNHHCIPEYPGITNNSTDIDDRNYINVVRI